MATPVRPISLFTYKMIRENQKTNKTNYSVKELIVFAHNVLQIASKIDNEQYWLLTYEKLGIEFHNIMSKMCNVSRECYELNQEKLENGGREYAEKIIKAMPHSFIMGASKVLNEELKETKAEETLCV